MQVRIGTDIIEVERIEKAIKKHGDRFLNKIYTTKEIEYCNKNADTKYQHFAVRFAAKEAIYKALCGIVDVSLDWKDAEILSTESGRPIVKLNNKNIKIFDIDISLSHVKSMAIATVIVQY